jgi:hypothetical protein
MTRVNGKSPEHPSNQEPERDDFSAQLVACLECLADYVDQTPTDDPALYDSEFLTAVWQTIELTQMLYAEHIRLQTEMNAFIGAMTKAKEETAGKLVVAQPGDVRRLAQEG